MSIMLGNPITHKNQMIHYLNYPTKKNNVIVQANFPEGEIAFGHRFDPYGRQIYYVDAIIVAIFKCKPKTKKHDKALQRL